MSVFDPIVEEGRFGTGFREVARKPQFAPARAVIDAVYERMGDPDGNFVEQFQTTGFDARLWELYLFAAFEEQGWSIDRSQPAPDFFLSDERLRWGVEATTASGDRPAPKVTTGEDLLEFLSHELPIRLGSPLFSKLTRRYDRSAQMQGNPLVLAVECFISDDGHFFSETTIGDYLFGLKSVGTRRPDGTLDIAFEPIDEHRLGDKVIPSGFFNQPDADGVSAVLFSNAGTISKFNRIGYRQGVPSEIHSMLRFGTMAVHDPDASEPDVFWYDVRDGDEAWSQGMVLLHNPNARHPLPTDLLPQLAHYRFEDGKVVGYLPQLHIFSSRTFIVVTKSDEGGKQTRRIRADSRCRWRDPQQLPAHLRIARLSETANQHATPDRHD
jgi:hypothetical protein